jgi:hypothetical protein
MKTLLVLILAIVGINSIYGPAFWPLPNNFTIGSLSYSIDPCTINYKISTIPVYLN